MQILSVSEVSGGPYVNRNPNNGTDPFYILTRDNFKQSRIQCIFYLLQMINSSGLHTDNDNKCQLMMVLPNQLNKRTDF